MEIKILGPGCANCYKVEETVKKVVSQLGIQADVIHIKDLKEIFKYTQVTPGLLVNGKLKHSGFPLPSEDKIRNILIEELNSK
ncbi:MAG: thioredoxin family protein [Thermodesulfovibrio sp.]|jgi:small redox-active disulfide protein 2|uniref:thioredoxin family protein n=1 Tax=unclassified Thermodesulfovibrio TaxID=2645936 RepID=UPI00083B273C|nr:MULTISPECIES: thioredoxin family protein [unclassified Thermodesulfovibrio]MDI1472923.1 thioredoxin family protein [Thermodesulfovibrio sp. 1176]MDI6714837.1 thioredoxin family protein [Thermodesulfovibrio sp.]ODA44778.1 redox-active disulfide protein 2 [Thermodesulfovibrio sp. N1]